MKSVREARRLLLIIAIVLAVIAAGASAWLLSPSGRNAAYLHDDYKQLRADYEAKLREVGPARDMDKRLAQAREQQAAFYAERVPTGYAAISQALIDTAQQNEVQVSAVKYEPKSTDVPALQRVNIVAQFTGDYGNVMRFINAMERSKMFFVIDSVELGDAVGGKLRLQIHFETFLRSA
jgi:Tfp pilus assembly protein PilO